MDITKADDIKKRWQEYSEELYKKHLQKSLLVILGTKFEIHVETKQFLIKLSLVPKWLEMMVFHFNEVFILK